MVTVTLNRAHLLPRVYASLCEQTFRDFEWIVVDDGSTDDTGPLIAGWAAEERIRVRYLSQSNSGWHVGFNRAALEARGRYLNNLDSDDWYPADALERWDRIWRDLPDASSWYDVIGLCAYADGSVVGDRFPADALDTDHLDLRLRWRVRGDKAVSCRTDVSRAFPYPEDLGSFVTITMVWNRVAAHFRTRCVNDVLKFVEYQPEGLSARTLRIRAGSPRAACVYYQELLASGRAMQPRELVRAYANYLRYALHGGDSPWRAPGRLPLSTAWLVGGPAGAYLYLRDRWRFRKGSDRRHLDAAGRFKRHG